MKLTNKEKREAVFCLENYMYAFKCRKCHVIYGSDSTKDDGVCVICNPPFKKNG